MGIFTLIAFLLGSLVVGLILRIIARSKPKTEFVIWGVLMTIMLFFFIYSLVLVLGQETPLFTKHHMANEAFVISSSIFLVFGFLYFRNIKKSYDGKQDERKDLRATERSDSEDLDSN